MINVTHEEPFQFHANPDSYRALEYDNGSLDVASNGSYTSFHDDHRHRLYSPDGFRRGRNADRRGRRGSPLVHTHNGHAYGNTRDSGGSSGSTRRQAGQGRNTNGNAHGSRSSSQEGSFRSRDSSYSFDPAYDDYQGYDDDGYGYGYDPEDDVFDPEEEAHIRRLRGPKLNARILPLPAEQIEIDEEEERIRKEEEDYARGNGYGGGGELTPVQERTSMSMTPKPEPLPEDLSVEPLNEEDHDAVSCPMLCLMAPLLFSREPQIECVRLFRSSRLVMRYGKH